jgi:hypothetical protein
LLISSRASHSLQGSHDSGGQAASLVVDEPPTRAGPVLISPSGKEVSAAPLSPSICWRQHANAIRLQGMAHLMDPGAPICLAGEREQPTEDDTHEQQRNKQASCTRRLSGRPRPTLPVQALQVLHPWIPRHALCSGHCSLATTTHAAWHGGTHRILISGPQGSRLSADVSRARQ